MVTVSRNSIIGKDDVKVTNGAFSAGPLTQNGAALNPGTYTIEINSPNSANQPQSVSDVFGRMASNSQDPM